MSRIATMGTASCACFAVAGFSDEDMKREMKYMEDPSSFNNPAPNKTVKHWYDKVLYPTSQPLGQTGNYPFSRLMEEIRDVKDGRMDDKFIIITINSYQYNKEGKFWPKRFEHWGFELFDKTQNNLGELCYIFVRNKARVDQLQLSFIIEIVRIYATKYSRRLSTNTFRFRIWHP